MNINNRIQIDNYIKQISNCKRITIEREVELVKIIASSSGETKGKAINELVEANLLLVVKLAIKRADHYNVDVMDFIYAGNIALFRAAKHYSLDYKNKGKGKANFCTLAHIYINNDMKEVSNRLIYMPQQFNHFASVIGKFEAEKDKKATIKDVAIILGVSLCRAKEIRAGLDIIVDSTETRINESETLGDILGERDPYMAKMFFRLDISRFIKNLKPKELEVINLMYFNGGMGYSEVGRVLNRSKQNIEQIAYKAIRKIKTAIIECWNKEHKTNIDIPASQRIEFLRKVNLVAMHRLLRKEQQTNKKVYKEILDHYLIK